MSGHRVPHVGTFSRVHNVRSFFSSGTPGCLSVECMMSGHLHHACQVTPISSKAYLAMKRPFSLRGECRVCRDVGVLWLRVAPSHLCQYILFILFYTFFYKIKRIYIHTLPTRNRSGGKSDRRWNQPYIPTHPTHQPRGTSRRPICSLDPATCAASLP